MWLIHGKMYDLDAFMKHHPGGSLILESTRGEDATAAFESYHAMCDINKIRRIMEKYEVVNDKTISPTPFRFAVGEFYDVLRDQVADHFKYRGISHHANWVWVLKSIIQSGLFFISFILFCFGSEYSVFTRSLIAVFSSHMMLQVVFGVMHDSSHHAISTNPYVNELAASIWNTIALWDNRIWYKHHCFRHHSFVGTHDDPDTIHFKPFLLKSSSENPSRYMLYSTYVYFAFILNIFPGIWFGQMLAYVRGIKNGGMWRFRLARRPTDWFEITLRTTTVYCLLCSARTHIIIPILFAISANFWYSVCIIPDHDTFETEQNLVKDISNTDWGEVQVRNSGNFSTDNPYTVNLFGGINYQIEHHLFPTICHIHLPEVAKIVRTACAKYNIPYVSHPTIASAYLSAFKKFQYLAKNKPIVSNQQK